VTQRASFRARLGAVRCSRLVGLGLAAVSAIGLTGCDTGAGNAAVVNGASIADATIRQDSAVQVGSDSSTAVGSPQVSGLNRTDLTYRIRHALIVQAVAAAHLQVSPDQLAAAQAQVKSQSADAGLPGQLGLPASAEPDVIYDIVALNELIKALPANGVPVDNVSVNAVGVSAASREEAVALRSRYLAHPADLDADVAKAGDQLPVQKATYSLLKTPDAGPVGLYRAAAGQLLIFPTAKGYLVLKATGRSLSATPLTRAIFGSATTLSQFFDLGALLVATKVPAENVSVNPRYGVWDPASVQVVPGNDGL